MRKYNRRILSALVIAYRQGIINRKPLERWLTFKENIYHVTKYLLYAASFMLVFLLVDTSVFQEFKLDTNIYLGSFFFSKARIIKGLLIGIILFNVYRLGKYLVQVYYVKQAMKHFDVSINNIEMLNRVTFKINV